MKITGLEEYASQKDVTVEKDGPHVRISVDNEVAMLTPAQAHAVAEALQREASEASQHTGETE